jgi:hypothetical protein
MFEFKIEFFILFYLGANGDGSGAKITETVNDHLEKGKQFLAAGQLSDAISHFHSAIGMIKFETILIQQIFFFFCCLRCGSKKLSCIFPSSNSLFSYGKI